MYNYNNIHNENVDDLHKKEYNDTNRMLYNIDTVVNYDSLLSNGATEMIFCLRSYNIPHLCT